MINMVKVRFSISKRVFRYFLINETQKAGITYQLIYNFYWASQIPFSSLNFFIIFAGIPAHTQ